MITGILCLKLKGKNEGNIILSTVIDKKAKEFTMMLPHSEAPKESICCLIIESCLKPVYTFKTCLHSSKLLNFPARVVQILLIKWNCL